MCLAGGGATSDEAEACASCPGGRYKLTSGNYDSTCDNCEFCEAGSTRTGCGLGSAGTCTGWATPTVVSVTGTGQQSGGTPGNEILDIFGKFYGDAASAADATHVVVKYGLSGSDPSTWYTALSCSVVDGDIGLASNNVALNQGQIRCLTAPGYGTGHVLTVTIGTGSSNVRTSAVFATADINYAAPIVAIYSGPGSDEASTFGGQSLIVTGANFGPVGTPVDSASYGEGPYQLPATCTVSVAHSELTCTTSAGGGKELKLVVTIGGQTSTIPAINYGVPELKNTLCGTTHGELINGVPQCSCTNCPNLNNNIPAITIGAVPCWHRNDIANPGGVNCPNTLPTPIAGDFNGGTRLSTKGYQLIILNGINFGSAGTNTRDAELESVTYGPSTGAEISMPLVAPNVNLSPSQAGCKIYKTTFSILCNTKPGIAGPHRWIITVKGQASQEVVNTRYSAPQISSVVPSQFSTSGGTTVVLTGTEFGTADSAATFRIIFTKGAAVDNCNNAVATCHAIAGTKLATLANGNERVSFPTPSGYGPEWSVRMIVSNTQTGQSVSADVSSSITVGYANPSIDGLTVINTGSSYSLTILGTNFCDKTNENCARLYLCGGGDDEEFCDPTTAKALAQPPALNEVTTIDTWTHTRIVATIGVGIDYVYVQVGQGIGIASAKSNNAFFSTAAYNIHAGGDFSLVGVDLEHSIKIPTSGQNAPKLKIQVVNLEGACVDVIHLLCLFIPSIFVPSIFVRFQFFISLIFVIVLNSFLSPLSPSFSQAPTPFLSELTALTFPLQRVTLLTRVQTFMKFHSVHLQAVVPNRLSKFTVVAREHKIVRTFTTSVQS